MLNQVQGDNAYGQSPEFRDSLEDRGFDYVLEVPKTTPVWPLISVYESEEWSTNYFLFSVRVGATDRHDARVPIRRLWI